MMLRPIALSQALFDQLVHLLRQQVSLMWLKAKRGKIVCTRLMQSIAETRSICSQEGRLIDGEWVDERLRPKRVEPAQ